MNAKQFKYRVHQALNTVIENSKRQKRLAVKLNRYDLANNEECFINGLELARTIVLTTDEDK